MKSGNYKTYMIGIKGRGWRFTQWKKHHVVTAKSRKEALQTIIRQYYIPSDMLRLRVVS